MLLTLLYFTYYGIACVAITPNLLMAAILSGSFYGLMNLFAGFVITKPQFPGWWIWVRTNYGQYMCCQFASMVPVSILVYQIARHSIGAVLPMSPWCLLA